MEKDSILISIKKLLGISEEDTCFDTDITIHINTAFAVLNQLGVGPSKIFYIVDDSNTWDEFANPANEMIKTYVYLRVRSVFDPPTSSIVAEAFNKSITEMEWRLKELYSISEE